jgi:AcrR family transcriptional regulator
VTQSAKRPYRRAEQTREHVLDVAARLFYAEGIRAVGIDRIAEEAEVTITTLYRLFGSKDGLVTAYLRRADQEWFARMAGVSSPGELIRLFDQLDQEACDTGNRGCAFRMALAEYPAPDSEIHCVALENRLRTRARLREIAVAAGALDPDVTAEQLMLIMEGISASAPERTPSSPPGAGPALARILLGASK